MRKKIAEIQAYDPHTDQFVTLADVVEGGEDMEIAALADIVHLRIHYVNPCMACNGKHKDDAGFVCLRCGGTGEEA